MLMTKHVLPAMLEAKTGSIINTSSSKSLLGDSFGSAYGASQAAVNCLTLYVATQYGRRGIRCNAIFPGLVLTPTTEADRMRGVSGQSVSERVEIGGSRLIQQKQDQKNDR